ncbi:MAG: hypothetical protein U9R42_14065 [Bacteroidota bacterium]|nr:hypothetical protein [Bacteroidota bacterium]
MKNTDFFKSKIMKVQNLLVILLLHIIIGGGYLLDFYDIKGLAIVIISTIIGGIMGERYLRKRKK